MSATNTDTGDTVNITTTEVTQAMEKINPSENQFAIDVGQDEPAPREALVSYEKYNIYQVLNWNLFTHTSV